MDSGSVRPLSETPAGSWWSNTIRGSQYPDALERSDIEASCSQNFQIYLEFWLPNGCRNDSCWFGRAQRRRLCGLGGSQRVCRSVSWGPSQIWPGGFPNSSSFARFWSAGVASYRGFNFPKLTGMFENFGFPISLAKDSWHWWSVPVSRECFEFETSVVPNRFILPFSGDRVRFCQSNAESSWIVAASQCFGASESPAR